MGMLWNLKNKFQVSGKVANIGNSAKLDYYTAKDTTKPVLASLPIISFYLTTHTTIKQTHHTLSNNNSSWNNYTKEHRKI